MRAITSTALILATLAVAFCAVSYLSTVNAAGIANSTLTMNGNKTDTAAFTINDDSIQPTPAASPVPTTTEPTATPIESQASPGTYVVVGTSAIVLIAIFAGNVSRKNKILN